MRPPTPEAYYQEAGAPAGDAREQGTARHGTPAPPPRPGYVQRISPP